MKQKILFSFIVLISILFESCQNSKDAERAKIMTEIMETRKKQREQKTVEDAKLDEYIQELMTLIRNDENGNCKLDKFGNLYMDRRQIRFNFGGVFFDDSYDNQIMIYCKEGGQGCFNRNGYFEIFVQTSDKERTKILLDKIGKIINKEIVYKKYDRTEIRLPGN